MTLTEPLHYVAPGLHLLHHVCQAHELPPAVQVRVTILVGAPTTTHTVYESVDVMVHPLGVHLTEAVASSIWVSCCLSWVPASYCQKSAPSLRVAFEHALH